MKIEYRHGTSPGEAYEKIDGLLTALERRHGGQVSKAQRSWNEAKDKMEFSLEVRGMGLSGDLQLVDDRAIMEIKLPFLARAFSSRIEGTMREELDKLFK